MSGFSPRYKPPARPRRISEIRTGDEQVQIVGVVVDTGESTIVLDDGSGTINVLFEDPGLVEGVDVGSKVRVFGTPLNVGESHEIHATIVQDLEGLDLDLYKGVLEKIRSFEKEYI